MTFTPEREALLKDTLDIRHVKKVQGNDYIEGWHAINEANRIFGFGGWSYEVVQLESVSHHTNRKSNIVIGYICRVRVTVGDVVREDTGFGTGISGQDISACHEGASKEAVTDALKRALRSFGNQFGLALYDKLKTNVEDKSKNQPEISLCEKMQNALRGSQNDGVLESVWNDSNFKRDKLSLSPGEQGSIEKLYTEIKSKLTQKAA